MATPKGRHLQMLEDTDRRRSTGDHAPKSVLSRRQIDGRILAPTIDFEVELKLVTFVELTHARTLDSADVHERIRLAVITRDEAEALHRVKELDRTRSLLARQLALWRGGLGRNCNHITDNLQIGRRNLAAAIHQVELKLLPLGQTFKARTLNSADVDKNVFTAIFTLDEAEALLRVEELDDTFACADDLGRHSAATAAARTAWATKAATAATRRAATAAAETATVTAAEAATVTTAAETTAITAAEATTAATAAKTTAIKSAAETTAAATAAVGIESAFVTETIALVASATPPPSVKTHKNQ